LPRQGLAGWRDVATLLVSGLTYAQIARDLFVTRATVGFHTGRIYAKTGVASRAELIDLVRGGMDPAPGGLA
jgi:DNA-binding CsgD family transcriptional regulator